MEKNRRYDVFVWFSFNYSLLTLTEKSRRELKLKTLWFTVNNKIALCSFAHNSIFAPNQTLINLRKNYGKKAIRKQGRSAFHTHTGYSEPHTYTRAQKKTQKIRWMCNSGETFHTCYLADDVQMLIRCDCYLRNREWNCIVE